MPAFSFENISSPKKASPEPAMLKLPKRPEWVHRYRWLLTVLLASFVLYMGAVAIKLATAN